MKERNTGAVLLCCVLLSAWVRGLSIHNGFPYIYVGVIGAGDREKKRPKKPSQFFGFVLGGEPKNRLKKVGFRSRKTEKNRPKKRLQFSVHNSGCGVICTSYHMYDVTLTSELGSV